MSNWNTYCVSARQKESFVTIASEVSATDELDPSVKFDSATEVCGYLPNMTENHLRQMRFRGDGPPYIRVSPRRVVYRRSSVLAWLESREQAAGRGAAA